MRRVNRKLKATRKEHGVTQEDMAEVLGISTSSYCDKENGLSEFKQSEIDNILDLFSVEYEKIFCKNSHANRTKNQKPA
ncbi:helix-turn-helix transcriptional regulator [Fuchsiella alkaliacetigena]|uniref:helix-turn-helix transcriptional regulator n=1 Tax=Fuchsiella alkaliacetigena TaxID=957042 RepID=UPI00200A7958|nr:helix-turn-helix transcriptional regulator [Fuchsiella alkaliacetigena]MCK8825545.1 helix-turn-helix domain-containing protein [Fuchsiella alkaliacetigena]